MVKISHKGEGMCIPHGAAASVNNGYVKEKRPKKSIKRVSKEIFEKGDPDFVDERTEPYESKEQKKGLLESLFSS